MSCLSRVLRSSADYGLMFWCPGCDGAHRIQHGAGSGPRWGWNGNAEKPTFTPSILVSYPANPDAGEEFKEWRTARICHSFVTDGRIQFLGDCTHGLAGQTVDIPDWDEEGL
ncbi:DUF6527 family protein [Pseudomonas sp. RTC3]|uniref:DUF6527 family protein n=1 Tax=unclassified Pseudomonas TaxID=196821 RepID=UPI002AB43385|nr:MULTISPECIES: DUF6527 family protein [unclassified Pseudomonas]MEB0062441.1 DUF6527 family protein [Pseudomonas sp. RTC3]MDY7565772.1 DUF6527 family protein [Pseudomonas sp. 5C2]MEB0027611.1 DUF6527 family protein [Pseudomonas sp. MH9.2]MEB0240446.1 DUF6527 family protein [Pseudomonas sp. 5C2]WPX70332.1 DUF6527 family protein [Pseudomonas sp. MH9.2]